MPRLASPAETMLAGLGSSYAQQVREETAAIRDEIARLDPRRGTGAPVHRQHRRLPMPHEAIVLSPDRSSSPAAMPTKDTIQGTRTHLAPLARLARDEPPVQPPALTGKYAQAAHHRAEVHRALPELQKVREVMSNLEAGLGRSSALSGPLVGKRLLTVAQWAPVAITAVARFTEESPIRPHPLPTALALHLAVVCVKGCGLPADACDWLQKQLHAAIYQGGVTSVPPAVDRLFEGVMSLVTTPTVRMELDHAVERKTAADNAVDRLQVVARNALQEKRDALQQRDQLILRAHLRAWRGFALRERALHRTLRHRLIQLSELRRKTQAFVAWRMLTRYPGMVAAASFRGVESPRSSPSVDSLPSPAICAAEGRSSPVAAAKKGITFDTIGTDVGPKVNRSGNPLDDPAGHQPQRPSSPGSRGDETDSAGTSDAGEGDSIPLLGPFSDDDTSYGTPDVTSSNTKLSWKKKYILAKQRYRAAEEAARLLGSEKDRQAALLASAADCLERASNALLSGRSTSFAVKARDVVLNAQKLANGNFSDFIVTSTTGMDDVKPPVPCRGTHVLLSWANFMLEHGTGTNPKIGHIAAPFTDGAHYARIIEAVFPDSDVPARMRAIDSPLERMEYMLSALSRLCLGLRKTTHAASAMRAELSRQRSMIASRRASSFTATQGASSSFRRGSVSSQQQQSHHNAPITRTLSAAVVSSSSSGDADDDYQQDPQLQEATADDLTTSGPLLATGVRATDLVDGREDAHLVVMVYLFRAFASTVALHVYGDNNAIEIWMESSVKVERHVRAVELLVTSAKSWQLLLDVVTDACLIALYRLAKGERAAALFSDIRNDSILARFLIPLTAPVINSSGHGEAPESPPGDALISSWGLSDDELRLAAVARIHADLAQVVPDAAQRRRVIQATHEHCELLYGLFGHFAPASPVMLPTGLEALIVESRLVELGVVSRGTGLQLVRHHSRASRLQTTTDTPTAAAALQPMEFVVAMVHLSEMVAAALVQQVASGGSGKSTAAAACSTSAERFEYFVAHWLQSRVRLTTADAVRRILQQGSVAATVGQYNRVLLTLFGHVAQQGRVGGDGSPPRDVDHLALRLEDWTKLLKDLDMIDVITPMKYIQLVFSNSQDSFDAAGDANMSYAEFEEGMTAIALARVNSPYMSIPVRLHVFFSERLLPQLRRKYPAVFLRIGKVA